MGGHRHRAVHVVKDHIEVFQEDLSEDPFVVGALLNAYDAVAAASIYQVRAGRHLEELETDEQEEAFKTLSMARHPVVSVLVEGVLYVF